VILERLIFCCGNLRKAVVIHELVKQWIPIADIQASESEHKVSHVLYELSQEKNAFLSL
jgi:hypothetical protein